MDITTAPPHSSSKIDTVVIGGGISGLAIAYALGKTGKKVHVLENTDRLGGAVQTINKDGYLCEAGPNSFLVKSQEVWDFVHELGLEDSIVMANEMSNKRFLVKNGKMIALPSSMMGGVTTPLYSIGQKFRLLAEPFIGRSKMDDESLTSFVSRRMGPAFLEYGISALASGIYAGNPDKLSVRHAFGKVWNLEQKYGSLIVGAVRLMRERKKLGIKPFKSRMISFKTGLVELTAALGNEKFMTISTSVDIQSITRNDDGSWTVDTGSDGSSTSLHATELVLATPLDAYADLPFAEHVKQQMAEIEIPNHPPLSTLVLGFDRSQIAHPLDGFGALFPRLEKRFGLGAIFSTTLFPGRAPEGKVALMCFIGGIMQQENGTMPTDQMIREMTEDLRPLLGITGDPEFHSHSFWPRAIPQYDVGHQYFLDSLEKVEKAFPGLHLRGNFRGGPGLNDCLQSGLDFAKDN